MFFDSLCARYAKRRILCARLGEWVCASLVAGRVSVSLVFFFEEATMLERGGAKGGALVLAHVVEWANDTAPRGERRRQRKRNTEAGGEAAACQ